MWSILALGAAEAIINRIIDLDAITRLKLNALQGQCLRVVIDTPRLSVDVYFDQDKLRFEPTALGQAEQPSIFEQRPFDPQQTVHEATATLQVKNLVELFKLLNSKDDALGNIPLQGDYHLLFALKEIMAQVDPDLAAHLSPWIGPTLAHEIGKFQSLPKHLVKTAKSAEFMFSDSLKEDSGLFASRWQMTDLQQQTRQLNQQIDRIEARIQQISQQFDASHNI
ncbi:hypothetical protein GCM10023206_31700 [Acinetobacter puyangensis]|uniref:Ubiquinone biosynthesis protein UbiJ n=1 Tax=Acinetobacter puyangensis TaxID=1096779 RepID=A0A240E2R6_9GAMM|nr:hypothetical protein [Acinetobacter puyangensis]SNX43064.1 ubiquinone biosynthesis protein UbiJ [Acinetobacter puyangensis]